MSRASVYRWSELATDRPMPLILRQRVIGERVMISRVVLEHGFRVPTHTHENEQMAVVLSGRVRFTIDEGSAQEAEHVLTGGEVLVLPSNVPHAAEALEETVILDVFSPVSERTGIDRR